MYSEDISSVDTEEISSVCTEDISSLYTEDISSVYSEDVKVAFRVSETILFSTPADPADPPDPADLDKMGPEPALRPSLPHAPGARMTAVTKLTPSNDVDDFRPMLVFCLNSVFIILYDNLF